MESNGGAGLLSLGLWRAVVGAASGDDGRHWYGLGLLILLFGVGMLWSGLRSYLRITYYDFGEGLAFFGLGIIGLSIWPFTQLSRECGHIGIWIGTGLGILGAMIFVLGLHSVRRSHKRDKRRRE